MMSSFPLIALFLIAQTKLITIAAAFNYPQYQSSIRLSFVHNPQCRLGHCNRQQTATPPVAVTRWRSSDAMTLSLGFSELASEALALAIFSGAVYLTLKEKNEPDIMMPVVSTPILQKELEPKGQQVETKEKESIAVGETVTVKMGKAVDNGSDDSDSSFEEQPASVVVPVEKSKPIETMDGDEPEMSSQVVTATVQEVAYTKEKVKETQRIIAENSAKRVLPASPPIATDITTTTIADAAVVSQDESSKGGALEKKPTLWRRFWSRLRRILIKILKPWKKFSDIK